MTSDRSLSSLLRSDLSSAEARNKKHRMAAVPLRHWPRLWRAPPLHLPSLPLSLSYLHVVSPISLLRSANSTTENRVFPISTSLRPHFFPFATSISPSSFSRTDEFHVNGLILPGGSAVVGDDSDCDDGGRSDGVETKSRNQKKREARRAVKWGMDLAELSPTQIKRILRVASLDNEIYDALMLVKRLGPDVREGKRRQFNYIGRLLRDVEPKLMDELIQASKDNDNNKLQALSPIESWTDKEDDEEDEETDSQEQQSHIDTATRWFNGLLYKDPSITSEVYSLHNVQFDRQELRKLVRRVQNTNEAETVSDDGNESAALTKARNSLLRFLRRLAKQMSLTLYCELSRAYLYETIHQTRFYFFA